MKFLITFFFCFLFIIGVNAQLVTVSGIVTDTQNEPIPGASVLIKGTTKGTLTGTDGTYSLQVPSDATLVFSYVGMGDIEEAINGRRNIDANLGESANQIADVVVVGYGVQRRSDITGAVASVKMDDALKSMPVARVTDALQGRLAGVSIVQSSGAPGSAATIRVRGMNSIGSDIGPLVVIDGFIGGDFASLNPSDIQSIEVLKDASATAVYGSRGANGVLLVTTKRASKGATQVTYNGYVNFKTPATLPKQLSAADNARLQNDYISEWAINNPGNVISATPLSDDAIAELERTGGVNFLDGVFKEVALEQMHEVSVVGRGEITSFLISGSFNQNNGIVRNSSATRANYRVKVDTDVKKWLKLGVNLWGTYSRSQGPNFGQNMNLLHRALSFPRFVSGDPTVTQTATGYYDLSREPDPRRKVNNVNTDGYTYSSWLQGYAEITILPGLTFRTLGAVTLSNTNTQSLRNKEAYESHPSINNSGAPNSASVSNSNGFSWLNTNILSYIKEFTKDHRINVTAVFEQSTGETFANGATANDLFFEHIGYNNMALAKQLNVTSSRSRTSMMSVLGRLNYVAFDRYMITASYRYDGSSRLAVGNQWFGFPSVALAWDAKKEAFLSDISWLSQSKLRLGYGITGNQAVPPYSAYSKIYYTVVNGQLAESTSERANPNLRWESTTQYNIGLDFGFLENRVTVAIDGYRKLSEDVILDVLLPPTSGFTSELVNAAAILNQGIEVTIGADPIATSDLRWHTDITLTHNRGTIEKIDGIKTYMSLTGAYETAAFRYIVGEKLGTMWGAYSDGVWKTTDNNPYGKTPGSYRHKDLNNDGKITDPDDYGIIGNGQPSFSWGWNNTLSYKGFDLSLFLIGMHGFDIYNNTEWMGQIDNRISPNPVLLNRWRIGNENTDVAGFVIQPSTETPKYVSRKVEKGDFVKVKNITLGYTLPNDIMQKIHIKNLRIYASLQNPFLFTGYSGLDPEVTLKSPITPGADWGYYPNGRNYIVGVNFTF